LALGAYLLLWPHGPRKKKKKKKKKTTTVQFMVTNAIAIPADFRSSVYLNVSGMMCLGSSLIVVIVVWRSYCSEIVWGAGVIAAEGNP
jgi:hypothetical protein